jgi:hypothetical protein
MAEVSEEAWYETKTIAAIDAFYSSGNVADNLEYARDLLQRTPPLSLQEVIEELEDDRRDAEFVHPVERSPLRGSEFESVTRQGYLEAIALALAHEDPLPIKTFWRIWDGSEFKMLVTDGTQQVSVTLVIPRGRLSGWELEHSTCQESWVVSEDGQVIQTSGPPKEQRPSLRGNV